MPRVVLLIIVIDFKERVIFDFMNYFLILSGIIVSIIMPDLNPLNISTLNAIFTGIIGFSLFFALRFLFQKKQLSFLIFIVNDIQYRYLKSCLSICMYLLV